MSEVQWGLLGPGYNAMETLQAAGQTYPQRQQREQFAQEQQQRQTAMNLAHFDKLDARQREEAKQQVEQFGQLALVADTPEKWDAIVRQYVQQGHPEAAQFLGKFTPELRQAMIVNAGEAKAYLDQQKPQYMPVGENGIVNVKDPAALAQVAGQFGQQPQTAPQQSGPPVGTVHGGFRFKGGNPNDRANWERAGGAGSGPQTFP